MEEAKGYKWLQDKFGYSMEQIATRMGKSRSQISNMIRLLQLPDEVLGLLEEGKVTIGHVRQLLTIEDKEFQRDFAFEIYQSKLSVREDESMVSKIKQEGGITPPSAEEFIEEEKPK